MHKTLASASKCANVGQNGWVTKGGGYLIPEDSALSHNIKKLIEKETLKDGEWINKVVRREWSVQFLLGSRNEEC